jgi:hypothetical protein
MASTTSNNIINNTNLDNIKQTVESGKKDKLTLKKPIKLQGEWNLDPKKVISSKLN